MLRKSLLSIGLISAFSLIGCATQSEAASQTSAPAPEIIPASTTTNPVIKPQAPVNAMTQEEKFAAWKQDFIKRAVAKGHDAELVRSLILPAEINERALDRDADQPEFTKPVWSYVDNAASADRLNNGLDKLAETDALFDQIEARYKVSRHYLTAIWGLESAYGEIMGDHDLISALSTFAFDGRRSSFGESQLMAILDMIKRGDIRPDQLIGSWAGAMGMTQFIPATMRDYAVDFDNNANIDLRDSAADALGSAAHYLSRHGWKWGEPAMSEVSLPSSFDYSLSDGTKKTVNDWTVLGVRPIGGERWSTDAGLMQAKLLVPAGHAGPKFLTFKNFDVIKKYNNSTSYAMGITVLAETFQGRRVITTDWPRDDEPISFTQKQDMQQRLTDLGFDTKGVDGMIGPNSLRAIRAWQKKNGLVADGYVNLAVWNRLMGL